MKAGFGAFGSISPAEREEARLPSASDETAMVESICLLALSLTFSFLSNKKGDLVRFYRKSEVISYASNMYYREKDVNLIVWNLPHIL